MVFFKEARLGIYFGDARQQYLPSPLEVEVKNNIVRHAPFKYPAGMFGLKHLVFPHQVHETDGLYIDSTRSLTISSFSHTADFLITDQTTIGLGISTADCLPLILYDTFHHTIASIHAGWKGTIAGIAQKAVHAMKNTFGSHPRHIKAYFGPSAKVCCYAVGDEIIEKTTTYPYYHQSFKKIDHQWYFDLPLLNKLQLQECGIELSAFKMSYNVCTICNLNFCSYRRQKNMAGRQMTIATLL